MNPSSSPRPPSPFKAAKLTPLTTPYRHSLHAYQGICPWSPDGKKLLYVGFEECDQTASLVVRDLESGTDIVLGDTRAYDYHTAAYQHWILKGQAIVHEDSRDGHSECGILRIPDSSYPSARHPGLHVRDVSASTLHGYGTLRDQANRDAAAARVHFVTGEIEILFTAEEAALHVPAEFAEDCQYQINHTVPNPDESLMFFKLCKPSPTKKTPGKMEDWGVFFVYDLQAKTYFSLGQRISGHPQWMRNGTHVLNVMQPLDGSDNRWIVTQNAHTSQIEKLLDLPIEGPGHPVQSPDGRYIATDAYSANREVCPVYLIDLHTGQVGEIARFHHSTKITDTYQPKTIFRANLHPVWSPDGKQLLINVNDGGKCLSMVLLEDFFA